MSAGKKTSRKKSPVKKGKVSVSPAGLISLCGGIIVCCLVLLLVTTIIEGKPVPAGKKASSEVRTEATAKTKPAKEAESKKEPEAEMKTESVSSEKESTIDLKELKNSKKKTEVEKKKTQSSGKTDAVVKTEPAKKETAKTEPVKKEPVKTEPAKTETVQPPAVKKETVKPEPSKTESDKPVFGFPQAVSHAQLCILMDDGGQNLDDLEKFLALKIPLTVAVLPKLRDSVSSASAVRAAGNCELMLHQPMQAVNLNVNPGPGAIKPDMSAEEIKTQILSNLREIGPVAGMNNHEGSLITADAGKMETIIDLAHMQGIYFLDSRTNKETKVPYVSREMGYGWYERNGYFLDNEKTREEFLKELKKNLDIANKTGCVIMIAHVWSADYMPALIREVYPELVAKGYSFTTVGKSRGYKQ